MGENVVVLGKRMVGGGWWWWMDMLCCAALLLSTRLSQPNAQRKGGRDRAGRRKPFLSPSYKVYGFVCFLLLLLLFYNQDHQLKSSSLPPDSRVDPLALATPMDRSRANCHF